MRAKGYTDNDALDELQVLRDCCRIAIMTNNDISRKIVAAGRPVTMTKQMYEAYGAAGRTPPGSIGESVILEASSYPSRPIIQQPEPFETATSNGTANFTDYESEVYYEAVEGVTFTPEVVSNLPIRSNRPSVRVTGSSVQRANSLEKTDWNIINWDIGKDPVRLATLTHVYDPPMTDMKIAIQVFRDLSVQMLIPKEGQPKIPLTLQAIIGAVNEYVNDFNVSPDILLDSETTRDIPQILLYLRYQQYQNEVGNTQDVRIRIAHMRETLNLSNKVVSFSLKSGIWYISFGKDLFPKRISVETLANQLFSGATISDVVILQDTVELRLDNKIVIRFNNREQCLHIGQIGLLMNNATLPDLVGNKITSVLYCPFKVLEDDVRSLCLIFSDNSVLIFRNNVTSTNIKASLIE
jgi:hypothetical protein